MPETVPVHVAPLTSKDHPKKEGQLNIGIGYSMQLASTIKFQGSGSSSKTCKLS